MKVCRVHAGNFDKSIAISGKDEFDYIAIVLIVILVKLY